MALRPPVNVGRRVATSRVTSRISVVSRRSKAAGTPAPNAPPPVTQTVTDKGIQVDVKTQDPILKELALQRVQKEKELEQQKLVAESRRGTAEKNFELQNRALAIQVEQRGVNVEREKSNLSREARIARSNVLSRAAEADVTRSSAFKASQIALKSGLTRETEKLTADEQRNQLLDQIRREEIAGNRDAAIASNPDPINVFLGADTAVGTQERTNKTIVTTRLLHG